MPGHLPDAKRWPPTFYRQRAGMGLAYSMAGGGRTGGCKLPLQNRFDQCDTLEGRLSGAGDGGSAILKLGKDGVDGLERKRKDGWQCIHLEFVEPRWACWSDCARG